MKTKFIILMILTFSVTTFADTSFRYLANDCESGDAKACLKAGKLYSNDPENAQYSASDAASIAANYYKRSCLLGYAEGCTTYGMHFYADTERDPKKDDLYYFKKGCDGGDQTGCTLLKMAPHAENSEP